VKVWVRIRPSSNFARDAIELQNDSKVGVTLPTPQPVRIMF